MVALQLIGIPILSVRDVFVYAGASRVPLAPPEVAGLINLRGRVIPVICARKMLGLALPKGRLMAVCLAIGTELAALLVDDVGEVVELPLAGRGPMLPNTSPEWLRCGAGIWRLNGKLMIEFNPESLARQQLAA